MGFHQQKIIILCTVDDNFGMSKNNTVPWDMCENNIFIQRRVKNNVVVMGRNMWFNSTNKFPHSSTYVLSENSKTEGIMSGGLAELKTLMNKYPDKDIYILGGVELFELYMYSADEIILTQLKVDYNCDVFFPFINENYEIVSYNCDIFSQEENCFYQRIFYKQSGLMHPEYQFLDLCKDLIENGDISNDNKEKSIYIKTLIFDTKCHFPLLTTIKTDYKKIISDISSTLNGNGEIGFNWRFFGAKFSPQFEEETLFDRKEVLGGLDQLKNLDSLLMKNPLDKNLILSCCNPLEPGLVEDLCQFFIVDGHMSLIVTIPKINALKINDAIAFYSIILYIFSTRAGNSADKLFINLGKISVKRNNYDKLTKISKLTPRPFPVLVMDKVVKYKRLEDVNNFDFTVVGNAPEPVKFKRCLYF
jgi:dihydrofolate reductase